MSENLHFNSFFLVLFFAKCTSLYLDVDYPIIYFDPTEYFMKAKNRSYASTKSSYFGTSVLLYPGNDFYTPWIQIGAPRADSPNIRYKNPGTIFRCPINERCEYIEIDKEFGQVENRNGAYMNKLDGAWIGSVMDINIRSNRSVVCAPRWMKVFSDTQSRRDFRMLGACYWSYLNSKEFHKKIPLFGSDDVFTDVRTRDTVYNYGQGEAGFSLHIPEAEDEVLVGAPGIYNWKGSTLLLKDKISNENDSPVASKLRSSLLENEVYNEVRVGNARKNTHLFSFGLFGYSVTSGHFFSRMSIHYASGAPRSKAYRGEVLVYDYQKMGAEWILDVKSSLQGDQFGEYFGAALAAGDLDGDGYDDLFIGAPFRKTLNYNEGRMYLYFGSNKGSFKEPLLGKYVENSQYFNAQFGTSIVFLGDMNRDKSSEIIKPKYVAVSAPYEENGAGVVYIFTGNSMGLNLKPVQKIEGKSVFPGIKGFGLSISKPADVDGNGYDDLAIGAYQSGHVAVFRSKPLIRITSYFQKLPESISNEIKEFDVVLCHRFYSFRGLPIIAITRNIVVDEDFNRAYLDLSSNDNRKLSLEENVPFCENLKIRFRDSWPNAYDPLTLRVTHAYDDKIPNSKSEKILIKPDKIEGTDKFCQRCGVYDKENSVQTITEKIPFVLGCANDAKCVSELSFECKFQGVGVNRANTFILGASNVIELVTTVENKGEKAYLLRVQVDLPNGLSFKQIPTLCDQNRTRISCPIANPLNKNEKRSISLKLDMNYVNKRVIDDFLFVNVTMLTNSENKNPPSKMVLLNLKTEADVSISGKSGEQSYSYGKSKEMVEFQQIFQVAKYGLSQLTLIKFEINLPTTLNGKKFVSLYEPEGHLEGGQSLMFESSIIYLDEDEHSIENSNNNLNVNEIRNKRSSGIGNFGFFARLTDESDENYEENYGNFGADLLGNRTFKIDCNSSKEITCEKISGAFDGSKRSAIIQLKMILNTAILKEIIPKNAIIRYVSRGKVTILDPPNFIQSGKKPDTVNVNSFFVNDSDKKKVELWIIIVSVVFGLLLLLFLTLCLVKAGFFKRSKKEELEQLKAQTNGEEHKNTNETESSSNLL